MNPEQILPEGAAALLQQVSAAIVEVFAQTLCMAVKATGGPQAEESAEANAAGTESAAFTSAGALGGVVSLALVPADAVWVAQKFVGMPDEGATEPSADGREALAELWRQVMGQVAATLRGTVGEVRFELLPAMGGQTAAAASVVLEFDCGGRPLPVAVTLDRRLVQTLALAVEEANSAAQPTESATAATAGTVETTPLAALASVVAGLRPENLELLLEVELPATLRFGQKQMRLSEIMQLAAGAVIDLDREVNEPIELLVDGHLIARGEAVIVDGNYGLRVTELVTAGARLAVMS